MDNQSASLETNHHGVRIAVEELSSHLDSIEGELENAGLIVLTRAERAIAEIKPLQNARAARRRPFNERMPDFEAQLREMWGDRIFPDSTPLIRADRDGE